jgi:hypothetical protein
MVRVGRLPRGADANQPDNVGGAVGERVEAVGEDADRTGRIAEDDLCQCDREVEHQHAKQHARDRGVAITRGRQQ